VSRSASDRLLLEAAAAPFPGWSVIAVEGRHRERFLHTQLSSDVRGLEVGASQPTALLDRTARLVSFGFLLKREQRLELLMPEAAAASARAALEASVIADDVSLYRVETPPMRLALGAEAVRRAGDGPPVDLFPIEGWGSRGFVSWGGHDRGLSEIEPDELEARRVLSGVPRLGVDAVPDRPVHESPLAALALSATKGCYLGQETVAKVASGRGAARAPMLLEVAGGDVDPRRVTGRRFAVDGNDRAGEVRSWAVWKGALYLETLLVRDLRVEGLRLQCLSEDGTAWEAVVRPLPLLETPAPEAWADRLHGAAVAAFAADREEDAVVLLERALAVCPRHADVYESLGVIYGRHHRYEEAIGLMERLLEVDPDSVMAHTNLSLYHNRLGRIEDAEREAAEALRAKMRREQGAREREEAEKRRTTTAADDRARRADMFRRVLEIDAGDALGNFGLGELLIEEERFGEAVAHLERALAADPRYSAAFFALGRAHEGAGELAAAARIYREGIAVAAARGDLSTANRMQERLAALTSTADA
jgi:folate-binding Fe-S cluster repair protein YgfZ/Flp pilus assembly protein TadD